MSGNSEETRAYYEAAAKLLAENKYEEALEQLEQVISRDPDDAITYVNKSAALMHMRRYEEVITACDRAAQLDPNAAINDPGVYINKYLALLILGREVEAAQLYDVIQQHPHIRDRLLRLLLSMMKGEAAFKRL